MARLQAQYADGYIHDELKLGDASPYEAGKNVFFDILEKRPEPEHGPLVRLTLFHDNKRRDLDWSKLPSSARPIRYKNMERDITMDGVAQPPRCVSIVFGYQYNDEAGRNHQIVEEL